MRGPISRDSETPELGRMTRWHDEEPSLPRVANGSRQSAQGMWKWPAASPSHPRNSTGYSSQLTAREPAISTTNKSNKQIFNLRNKQIGRSRREVTPPVSQHRRRALAGIYGWRHQQPVRRRLALPATATDPCGPLAGASGPPPPWPECRRMRAADGPKGAGTKRGREAAARWTL